MKIRDLFSAVKNKIIKLKRQQGLKPIVLNHDLHLIRSASGKKIPGFRQLFHFKKVFSLSEKRLFNLGILLFIVGIFWFGFVWASQHRIELPSVGGTYTEAVIGSPQIISPLFSSTNDVDADISQLVYSGLMRYDGQQRLLPDLAAKYTVSDDKKVYTFELRRDVVWHDGEKFTAKDVLFTFEAILNSLTNSPLGVSFQGIKVEAVDDYTVKFILPEAYSSFLSSLVVGVIPEHIWFDIAPEQMRFAQNNLRPIGTGPFKFEKLTKDDTGKIYQFILERFGRYYRQPPYLSKFIFQFYADYEGKMGAVEALREKKVDGINFVPDFLRDKVERKNIDLHTLELPQYAALFFNQEARSYLKEIIVRNSLALAIDKDRILREVMKNEGKVIHSPVLPSYPGFDSALKQNFSVDEANKLLDGKKWEKISAEDYRKTLKEKMMKDWEEQNKHQVSTTSTETRDFEALKQQAQADIDNELNKQLSAGQTFYRKDKDGLYLEMNLVTVDNSQFRKVAELVAAAWQEIGVKTNIKILSSREINREAIKSRNYDVLLYGEIVGGDPDLFPFWHSSQINYPGLNLSGYANRNVDSLIEQARNADFEGQKKIYKSIQETILSEDPAIFLYMPTYTYATSNLKGIEVLSISKPSDRFSDITNWYIKTSGKWQW